MKSRSTFVTFSLLSALVLAPQSWSTEDGGNSHTLGGAGYVPITQIYPSTYTSSSGDQGGPRATTTTYWVYYLRTNSSEAPNTITVHATVTATFIYGGHSVSGTVSVVSDPSNSGKSVYMINTGQAVAPDSNASVPASFVYRNNDLGKSQSVVLVDPTAPYVAQSSQSLVNRIQDDRWKYWVW